jgi:hypothetical protein
VPPFPHKVRHFHIKNVWNPLVFCEIGSMLQINGREIFQKERVDKGISGELETELAKRSGNWMLADGTEKALTIAVVQEEFGKRGRKLVKSRAILK